MISHDTGEHAHSLRLSNMHKVLDPAERSLGGADSLHWQHAGVYHLRPGLGSRGCCLQRQRAVPTQQPDLRTGGGCSVSSPHPCPVMPVLILLGMHMHSPSVLSARMIKQIGETKDRMITSADPLRATGYH